MKHPIVLWTFTVAFAGFLFGFDTAVISGADQPIQALWQTSDLTHGLLVMSSALWGTVLGALLANFPCDKFGRKPTLVAIGVLYVVSALGSAFATDPYIFSLMRFIGGFGVGVSSIAVPAYIAEIAPAEKRGRMVATYQFQIVFGILLAFLSNYLLAEWFSLDWRWMLGIEAVPALIYLLLVMNVPESPRWLLLHKHDETQSLEVLRLAGDPTPEATLKSVKLDAATHTSPSLFHAAYRLPVLLAFLVAMFNQLSGINFVIYFAPRIFTLAGLDASSALLSSAGIGLVNLAFTLVGLSLIDRMGRRQLLYIGSIGYLISLSLLTCAFYFQWQGIMVVGLIFLFIAAHAMGQGAVIWVFISEIFPNAVRAKGQSLGSSTHWIFAALIALLMPWLLNQFSPALLFGFFTLMMAVQLVCVISFFPETRGQTLEHLGKSLSARKR
ncbi:sugar porter family MFS transporter [Alteromonas confluentis]|uniref:MFS transporter n=1 Tax=Alteromonas confluentis TaxID=1656094 RepID=A0A1E7ZFC1_9ALTE|nr:sugar porter family MFS transporter [Alteromonas confluentis]OFC72225.1 MFS transporter [Alteromonas confluentis]